MSRAKEHSVDNQNNFTQKKLSNGNVIGATQIIIGVGTIIAAIFAVSFIVLIVGIVIVTRGALDIFHTTQKESKKKVGTIFVDAFSLSTGILVLAWPQIGSSVLSLVLASLLVVGGGQKLLAPLWEKRTTEPVQVVFGLISVLLGIIIFVIWPIRSFTLLGIFVGIEIMLNGMTIAIAGKAVHTIQNMRASPRH